MAASKEWRQKFQEAYNAQDDKAAAEVWTKDCIVMPPDNETIRGREEWQKFLGKFRESGNAALQLESEHVIPCGPDLNIEIGFTKSKDADGKKKAIYKWMVLQKKVDGTPQLQVTCWNVGP